MGIFESAGKWLDKAASDVAQFTTEKVIPVTKQVAGEVARRACLAGKAIVSPDSLAEIETKKEVV